MGNYRSKLRAAGCAELQVNRHTASSDLGSKRKLKKAKKAETNFLPDVPQDKNEAVLEEERESMVVEMKKRKVDWNKMHMMMANTFSVRRKEIVENEPLVKEVKAKWPGLFFEKQVSDLWEMKILIVYNSKHKTMVYVKDNLGAHVLMFLYCGLSFQIYTVLNTCIRPSTNLRFVPQLP